MHVSIRSIPRLVLLALVAAATPAVVGAPACGPGPSAPRALADEASVEGTVRSVDSKAATFVLSAGGKDIVIRLDKDTRYVRNGVESKLAEVVAANARVKVVHDDGLASRVEQVAAPTAPPAKPKAPAKPTKPPPAKPERRDGARTVGRARRAPTCAPSSCSPSPTSS